jgi:hypothetical protein
VIAAGDAARAWLDRPGETNEEEEEKSRGEGEGEGDNALRARRHRGGGRAKATGAGVESRTWCLTSRASFSFASSFYSTPVH